MENVLKDIRDSEAKAKKAVEDAEKSKAEIINKARQDSLKHLNEAQQKTDSEKDSRVKSKIKALEEMKEGIRKRGESESAAIERKAKENLNKAEDFIMKRFEERI